MSLTECTASGAYQGCPGLVHGTEALWTTERGSDRAFLVWYLCHPKLLLNCHAPQL